MSTLSQFIGGSGGGVLPISDTGRVLVEMTGGATAVLQAKSVSTGSCTADTLKTILSVSGKGALTWLGVRSISNTSRTHRLKITIDGNTIFDSTSVAATSTTAGFIAHGFCMTHLIEGTPLFYESTLLIEYATSITESDKSTIGYINYLRN